MTELKSPARPTNVGACGLGSSKILQHNVHSYQVDGSDTAENSIDLLEVFAGEGGTMQLAIRRRLTCGKCVDLRYGTDLTKESEQCKLTICE